MRHCEWSGRREELPDRQSDVRTLVDHAVPDRFAALLLGATVVALVYWRIAPPKLMLAGSLLGVLRSRLASLQGVWSLRAATRL